MSGVSIPAIDLASFLADAATVGAFVGDADALAAARNHTAATLDEAASSVGFFFITLPGLATAAETLLQRCREFHALPTEAKATVANTLSVSITTPLSLFSRNVGL
jgi:isopenicillin N synthase-like dioxygenase